MPDPQGRSPIRRIFEEAFNQGNLAVVDEVLAPDHCAHHPMSGVPNGPQGLKLIIVMFRSAFPDLVCTLEDEIVAGDRFAARWSLSGTQQGMFLGNPPTGRPVQAPGMIFGRMEKGQIAEDWTQIDQMAILQQLGAIPPLQKS